VDLDKLHRTTDGGSSAPAADTSRAREALEQAVIGNTIDFLLRS